MPVYVLGFAFADNWLNRQSYTTVALIHKKRGPACIIKKLNGIGGHVEQDEPAHKAMVREFREETGVFIPDWQRFCCLRVKAYDALIHCYKAVIVGERPELQKVTDEDVAWYPVSDLPNLPVVPNLRWLVPMALDKDKLSAFIDDNTPGST